MTPKDTLGRPIRDIRISVTDRCNLRCTYCMPHAEYDWLAKDQVLSFEEIVRVAGVFVRLGGEKIRITGGEPLVRKNLHRLIRMLSEVPGIKDLTLTTNGALLSEQAHDLAAAGLKRINVSLDTLDPGKFSVITQRGEIAPVMEGLKALDAAGIGSVKINAVVIREFNEDEIVALAEFGRTRGYTMRFIEFMDVGNANGWKMEKVVSKREILEKIRSRYPFRESGRADGRAPAVDYEYADGAGRFGVIASVTEPFCGSCDRARLTPDGKLVTCLFSSSGVDLRALIRSGASDEKLAAEIFRVWGARRDRFSEERWAALKSVEGYTPDVHRKIEMIRLGG